MVSFVKVGAACALIALGSQAAFAQATTQVVSHYSESLQKLQQYRAIVPRTEPGERLPVLYVLHGVTDDSAMWPRRVPLQELANDYRMIIIAPDGGSYGWYLDSPVDKRSQYETYMTKELIAHVDQTFPTVATREGRAVMGFSMGGHGAMILATRNPDLYISASSISGILDIRQHAGKWQLSNRLGSIEQHPDRWEAHSNVAQVDALVASGVRRLFDCGLSDTVAVTGALEDNQALHAALVERDFPHLYRELVGGHTWQYVNLRIRDHLNFHQASMIDAYEEPEKWFAFYFTKLREYHDENARTAMNPPTEPTITLVGSSSAQGLSSALFPGWHVFNRGIASDGLGIGARGVTKRLQESVFDFESDVIVFKMGRNDLAKTEKYGTPTLDRVMEEWEKAVDAIRERRPNSKLIVTNSFPVSGDYAYLKDIVLKYNEEMTARCKERGITLLDMHSLLVGEDGLIRPEMTTDGLHLSQSARALWAEKILEIAKDTPGVQTKLASAASN